MVYAYDRLQISGAGAAFLLTPVSLQTDLPQLVALQFQRPANCHD